METNYYSKYFNTDQITLLPNNISNELFCRQFSLHSIRLSQVSKKLYTPESKILEILTDAGFTFSNQNNICLYDDHLAVLESNYRSSIKKLFKRFKKKPALLEQFGVEEAAPFFRRFIKNTENFEDCELFECHLDDGLIKCEFYSTLFFERVASKEDRQSFRLILRELKFKILKFFKYVRSFIFSTLILNHYHIFSSEEDSSKALTQFNSFFEHLSIWIEKAVIKINFITTFNYEKNRHFNLQYKTE